MQTEIRRPRYDLLEEIDNLITELKTDYDTSILGYVNGFVFKEAVKMFEFCRDNGYYDKTDNA